MARVSQSISLEDRKSLLKAIREEGFHRIQQQKEQILNKYFSTPKTVQQVDKILQYYGNKSRSYNPYTIGRKTYDVDRKYHLASEALSKWHEVLPPPAPSIDNALVSAIGLMASGTAIASERHILKFLASHLEDGMGKEPLSGRESLTVLNLIAGLQLEAFSSLADSEPQINHLSQSFWKRLQEKERSIEVLRDADQKLVASLDPFNLSERLKLLERIEKIIQMSVIIDQQRRIKEPK